MAITMLPVLALLLLARPADDQAFQELFNGRNLDGWVIDGPKEYKDKQTGALKPVWRVENGLLTCEGEKFGFLRHEKQQYDDFVFQLECRLGPKGNSGIGIRTMPFNPMRSRETRPSYFSYEIQILDDANKPADKHCSGSLYRYVAPSKNAMKPLGEWNRFEVRAQGPRIEVTINGDKVIDVDQTKIEAIKAKPYKGYVVVQSHSGKVEFRNIRIRELKATAR